MTEHPVIAAVRRSHGTSTGRLIAVSGGPDSVALFRASHAVDPFGITVCHVNHKLRAAESDADEQFVADLAHRMNVPFVSVIGQVPVGRGLEAAARKVRYALLLEAARRVGAELVATGHTLDDQAETILHRVIRGTGLPGLAGIPRRRKLAKGVFLIRPLLEVSRAAVLDYLQSIRQDARTDSTNDSLTYTRNRIRREILPRLAEINPRVRDALVRLGEQAADCNEDAPTFPVVTRSGPITVVHLEPIADWPRSRLRSAWRQLWHAEGWPAGRMLWTDFDRLAGLVLGEAPAIDLPGRIRAVRRPRHVQIRNVRIG